MTEKAFVPHGFCLLADQPQPLGSYGHLWEIVDVRMGVSTDWDLHVALEMDGHSANVIFPNVVSYRAHDEREMLEYWGARAHEGVGVGSLYSVSESAYKSEIQAGGVTGLSFPLTHFLLAGNNICVEVLSTNPPEVRNNTASVAAPHVRRRRVLAASGSGKGGAAPLLRMFD